METDHRRKNTSWCGGMLEFYVRVINNIKLHEVIMYNTYCFDQKYVETENGFWGRIFKSKKDLPQRLVIQTEVKCAHKNRCECYEQYQNKPKCDRRYSLKVLSYRCINDDKIEHHERNKNDY